MSGEAHGREGSGGDHRSQEGGGDGDRRRIGVMVATVPVVLFVLSVAFVALREPPGTGCRHDYGMERVRSWWQEAQREDVAVRGTRYLAFDDSSGCIHVGLEDPRAQTHLERRFRRLEIPREVVVYETVEGREAER